VNETAILTTNQALVLRAIDEQSQHGETWCDVSRIKGDALKDLEMDAYITVDSAQKLSRITALGKMALENHVIQGTPEHIRMVNQAPQDDDAMLNRDSLGNGRIPAKPYGGVMGKPKPDAPDSSVTSKPLDQVMTELFPPGQKPETTAQPAGETCAKAGCFEPRTVSKSGRVQRFCEIHQREYGIEQAAKARAGKAKKAAEANGTCAGCVEHEVLDMLRTKYPQIDDLVRAVEKVRDLRDSLGIQN